MSGAVCIAFLGMACTAAQESNSVAKYLASAERQVETPAQRSEIIRALRDMLDKTPDQLKAQRYADYQGRVGAWSVITLLEKYFVAAPPVRLEPERFYKDVSKIEARKVIQQQLAALEATDHPGHGDLLGHWKAKQGGIAEEIAFTNERTSSTAVQGYSFRSYMHQRLSETGLWKVDDRGALQVLLEGGPRYTFTPFVVKQNELILLDGKVRHTYQRISETSVDEPCPKKPQTALQAVHVFDGDPKSLATLVPDQAKEESGHWSLGYVYDAGRFVTIRCKYANGQTQDVKLTTPVKRCDYTVDSKKTLQLHCK